MSAMSFQQACDFLRGSHDRPTGEEDDALLMLAEATVLDHRPSDAVEASLIIDTLIDNLCAGARSDQRDLTALEGLRTWLGQSERPGIGA